MSAMTQEPLQNLPAPERPSGNVRANSDRPRTILLESDIRDGMVFQSTGANRVLRGAREIVVCSVYPGKCEATVNDLRTGHGWRMSLFTLVNGNRWEYTGVNAWNVEGAR